MKKSTLIWLIGIAVVCGLLAKGCSNHTTLVDNEENFIAARNSEKNNRAVMMQSLKAQGISVKDYGDLVLEVTEAAVNGKRGASAAFLALKESTPQLSPELHKKFQQVIQALYAKLEAKRNNTIDYASTYMKRLRSLWYWPVSAFFPQDVTKAELRKVVTSAEVEEEYESGQMQEVDADDLGLGKRNKSDKD